MLISSKTMVFILFFLLLFLLLLYLVVNYRKSVEHYNNLSKSYISMDIYNFKPKGILKGPYSKKNISKHVYFNI